MRRCLERSWYQMTEISKTRQKPSDDTIVAIRAALFAPVLKSRHLRSASDIAAPLRLTRSHPGTTKA